MDTQDLQEQINELKNKLSEKDNLLNELKKDFDVFKQNFEAHKHTNNDGTKKITNGIDTIPGEVVSFGIGSAGVVLAAISDNTNVWMTDSNAPLGTTTIRKYPVAGGSSTSTTTLNSYYGIYYQSPNNANLAMFLGSSSILGLGWYYSTCSPTAALGLSSHIFGITLP